VAGLVLSARRHLEVRVVVTLSVLAVLVEHLQAESVTRLSLVAVMVLVVAVQQQY